MDKIIEVGTGDAAVSQGGVIKTFGIGSCVAICIYDRKNNVGGMAHSMLPTRKVGTYSPSEKKAKYIDEAVAILINKIEAKGGDTNRLFAKITGGANIIHSNFDLGKKNIEFAKKILSDLGVDVKGEDVGGNLGRIAEFNSANGILHIRTAI